MISYRLQYTGLLSQSRARDNSMFDNPFFTTYQPVTTPPLCPKPKLPKELLQGRDMKYEKSYQTSHLSRKSLAEAGETMALWTRELDREDRKKLTNMKKTMKEK